MGKIFQLIQFLAQAKKYLIKFVYFILAGPFILGQIFYRRFVLLYFSCQVFQLEFQSIHVFLVFNRLFFQLRHLPFPGEKTTGTLSKLPAADYTSLIDHVPVIGYEAEVRSIAFPQRECPLEVFHEHGVTQQGIYQRLICLGHGNKVRQKRELCMFRLTVSVCFNILDRNKTASPFFSGFQIINSLSAVFL